MTDTSRWASHLLQDVLPWWEAHGADDKRGGVRTGFDNNGAVTTTDRFTWSQGRWAWLAGELADEATAGRLPVDAELWRARCLATCDHLVAVAVRPDHRTHFRVTEDGVPVVDPTGESATSVFADLFCVLGLAAGLRHLGQDDPRAGAWSGTADAILATAHRAIADGTAVAEPYPVPEGFTDLAGPMTLLHVASEVLRGPIPDPTRARDVRHWAGGRLADTHLGAGTWREFAPTRPGLEDTLLARHVTPGHLLEVLWMIEHAEAEDPAFRCLSPETRTALAERAIAVGWDGEHGGVLRYVDRDGGRPTGRSVEGSPYESLVRKTWDTKLWWVAIESVYALARLAPRSMELAHWATRVADHTMDLFPAPGSEWLQIRDRRGEPLNEVVALPVKDPFHIIRGLILLNRLEH